MRCRFVRKIGNLCEDETVQQNAHDDGTCDETDLGKKRDSCFHRSSKKRNTFSFAHPSALAKLYLRWQLPIKRNRGG